MYNNVLIATAGIHMEAFPMLLKSISSTVSSGRMHECSNADAQMQSQNIYPDKRRLG